MPPIKEADLLDVLSRITDSVVALDNNCKITYANQSYADNFGFKISEIIGKNIFSLLPKTMGTKLQQETLEAISKKEVRHLEFEGLYAKGCWETTIYPSDNGVTTISRNLTERKKAEEALKESEQLYKTIFDNSDDGFVLVEPIYDEDNNACDIRFLQINLAYENQTGTRASKVEGKRAKEVAPNLEQEWISLCGVVAKTGRTRRIESFNERTNKWYDASYIPFNRGRVGILFRDVTERKNREKQLQEKERLVAIGATAGMVGHDIRNPLQAITGDVFLLKDFLSSMPDMEMKKDVAESLDNIENNVEYINKIVQDLQDYTRPLAPQKVTFKLEDVCKEALYKKAIPQNVTASCVVQEEVKEIHSDPAFLKRILANLVNNAVQAMPQGGEVIVQACRKANNVIITVKDTGVGIPEEIKGKLFTPMFTTKSKGQGFGLAAVKRITEALGGTVSFESENGKGTKFIIELPNTK